MFPGNTLSQKNVLPRYQVKLGAAAHVVVFYHCRVPRCQLLPDIIHCLVPPGQCKGEQLILLSCDISAHITLLSHPLYIQGCP